MKNPFILFLFCLSAIVCTAQTTFPGLKAVLSEAEWKRAGLDRLTPDQIGVIDAALIRQQVGATARLQTELTQARAVAVAAAPANDPSRFGLPSFDGGDWRTTIPLKAKVTKMEGGNRFRLDNGQVWEGFEAITYELVNKPIEIHARPHGQFNLVVDGVNTTLRIMRLR